MGLPSMWTVQTPQRPIPQPYFVPVNPTCSRITHRSGVSGSTSILYDLPLTVSSIICVFSLAGCCRSVERAFRNARHEPSVRESRDVCDRHGMNEALKRYITQRFCLHNVPDPPEHLLVGQDLSSLRLAAKPRGDIGDTADARILPPPLEADSAERRVALRDADREIKVVAALVPCRA